MPFLKKIDRLPELCALCGPTTNHFKFNTCNTQGWRHRILCLTVLFVALILAGMARPTLVDAAVEYNQQIRFQDDFEGVRANVS